MPHDGREGSSARILALAPKLEGAPSASPPRIPQYDDPSSPPQSAQLAPNPFPANLKNTATIRPAGVVIPLDLRRTARPVRQQRVLAIGDCENETDAVHASLRFAGILDKRGKIKRKSSGAQIVQTGDLLHKNGPNPAVIHFWQGLRNAAKKAGCSLHIVAGNHELEIWRRLHSKQRLGLSSTEQRSMLGFIRSMQLFHAEGSVLFIHGYPTVNLLRHMQAYLVRTGKRLNDYNQDHFQQAFDDPQKLARYAYPRRNACRGSLLHDVLDPTRYYRRHGREIAALLDSFGIDLVIHGHRPERSGVQTDYELQRWLPGIRMINNDIQLRLQGLGATVIRQDEQGPANIIFINKDNSTPKHRKLVRRLLHAPKRTTEDLPDLEKMITEGQVSPFVRSQSTRAPIIASARRVTFPKPRLEARKMPGHPR